MAPFQAKIGSKRMTKRENKNCCYIPFLPDSKLKIPKQQQKKFKNTITGSFLAKIGQKRSRKTENKNYRSISFQPGTKQKIKKITKKLKN